MEIQKHFHTLIRKRAASIESISELKLPELKPLLTETTWEKKKAWFPVPGMYGGFSYWMEGEGLDAKLITESWCRVVGGSGQRHEITRRGAVLVDEGSV